MKSIYKAFKQSGAAINGNPTKGASNSNAHNDNTGRLNSNAMDSSENSSHAGHRGRSTMHGGRQRTPDYSPPPPHSRSMRNWIGKKGGTSGGPSVSMPLPESVARYAEIHGKDLNKRSTGGGANNKRQESVSLKGDVGAVLQAAAAAAAQGSVSARVSLPADIGAHNHNSHRYFRPPTGSGKGGIRRENFKDDYHGGKSGNSCFSYRSMSPSSFDDVSYGSGIINKNNSSLKNKNMENSCHFATRTQEEADEAAAALLAELDTEKLRTEASSKAKKNKKKKKKEKQQAAAAAKLKKHTVEESRQESKCTIPKEVSEVEIRDCDQNKAKEKKHDKSNFSKEPKFSAGNVKLMKELPINGHIDLQLNDIADARDCKNDGVKYFLKNNKKNTKEIEGTKIPSIEESVAKESDDEDIICITGGNDSINIHSNSCSNITSSYTGNSSDDLNDIEKQLSELMSVNDLEGIEKILLILKGVPGRAALRKNAKKAVKRIKEEKSIKKESAKIEAFKLCKETESKPSNCENNDLVSNTSCVSSLSPPDNRGTAIARENSYRAPEPLLKIVSHAHRVSAPPSSAGVGALRTECVMHMAPGVVGWVIGKGGQRIRDLMEESGAKVWIDQDSMGPKDMRIVYVSGTRKAVDGAVRMVKELVAKAPVGGVSISVSMSHAVNDATSVTSTRSSLTSTPVPPVQNTTEQATTVVERSSASSAGRLAHSTSNLTTNKEEHLSFSEIAQSPPGRVGQAISVSTSNPSSVSNSPSGGSASGNTLPTSNTLAHGIVDNTSSSSCQIPQKISSDARHEITCEPRFVPLLIGRRGWTVKQIQDTSGAKVDIDQTVNPRRVIISGDKGQVEHAVQLVREVLRYPHAELHYKAMEGGMGNSIPINDFQHNDSTKPFPEVSPNERDDSAPLFDDFCKTSTSAVNYLYQEVLPQQNSSHQFVSTQDFAPHQERVKSDYNAMMQQQQPYHRNIDQNGLGILSHHLPPSFPPPSLSTYGMQSPFQQDQSQIQSFHPLSSSSGLASTLGTLPRQENYQNQPPSVPPDFLTNPQFGLPSNNGQPQNIDTQEEGPIISQKHPKEYSHQQQLQEVIPSRSRSTLLFGEIESSSENASSHQNKVVDTHNFHLETILPLQGSTSPSSGTRKSLNTTENESNEGNNKKVPDSGKSKVQADRDIIADMFGPSKEKNYLMENNEQKPGSYFEGFNSISISEEGGIGLDWKSISGCNENAPNNIFQPSNKRSSSSHSVGLGGIRLDVDDPTWGI